jgi:23S rRNA pseudouridine1911/1915/1917 synthase
MTRHLVEVDRGDVGIRIDRVLLRHLAHLPGLTRNRIQRLIDIGAVSVDGTRVTRAASRVAAGAALTIDLPSARPRKSPVAQSLPLSIVYEDADLIVVDKPAGQVSHPAFRHPTGTLVNALLAHARGQWTPALVSRLDKGTSGLVLVAKSRHVQIALQHASSRDGIEKDYLAIVAGKPPARGTIDLGLDRDPWDRRRVTVRDRGGVPSVTTFARVKSVTVDGGSTVSLLRCRLVTGRMHQIRVHLAAKGWPVLGDPTYKAPRTAVPGGFSLDRQALHAWRLALAHPVSGGRIDVTAPLPQDMAGVLRAIGLDYSALARSSSTVPSDE